MNTNDVLRVAADLRTFTAVDLAAALDVPVGTAGGWLSVATRKGLFDRVCVRKTYLYSLSARAVRRVAKLPAIDPEERCLLLERITEDNDCDHFGTMRRSQERIVGYINHGATRVIRSTVYCSECGEIISTTEFAETAF